MKILVCIKQVPGTSRVEVDPETGVLIRDGIETKMNPYDLYALETALRLAEDLGATTTALSMGPMQTKEIIYESFYMGVNDGYLLSDRKFGGADVVATSYTLTQGVRKIGNFDLIICGKQTTDGDTAQVGPEMAEFLDIPHITNVGKILQANAQGLTVQMNLEDAVEIQHLPFPCLLTVDKDIYTPRLPSYKRKLESGDHKEISVLTLADMDDKNPLNYGLSGSPTKVERIFPPESNVEKQLYQGSSDELSAKLYRTLKEQKFLNN